MKTKILFAIIILFFVLGLSASLQAQTSGTISLHSDYTDNMSEDWGINTGVSKSVKITYSVDIEDECDYITIYDVDNAGNRSALISLTGSQSGTIYTTSKSGKAEIDFTSDGSVNYEDGYTGFDIQYSVDDRSEINCLDVTGDAYVEGNSYTTGKLGIGTTNPQAKLDTRGNAYISGLAAIGTVPFSGNKFYVYNITENIAFRAATSKSTTSPIYGIYSNGYNTSSGSSYGLYTEAYSASGSAYGLYSSVSGGSSSKKWAGYFTGGTVEIYGGKLRMRGKNNVDSTAMITFHDDARTVVSNSIVPSLKNSSFSMTNYGIAAPLVTGGAELWLSGYSGLRMFTGGVATPRLNITNTGKVGIGTTSPQYDLDVKGQIRATEVLIQSVDNFADYVFDKDYRLPELHEVKTYIDNNGHLPEIPSAKEAKENGVSLVDMQVKLLKKVEELTLYTIQQQEEIKALKDEVDRLKKQ